MADEILDRASVLARAFLKDLAEQPVGPPADRDALVAGFEAGGLPATGEDPRQVLERLAAAAEPGLVATAGPRYFGFVIGGSLPVALGADWLAAAWDQNAAGWVTSPAAAAVEEVVGGWLKELFGLPANSSVGFVTGGTMANFTALAAARHSVLERAGWDVEADGLAGGPPVRVIVGEEAHATIFAALRMLGLGDRRVTVVPADGQGRMRPDELRRRLAGASGPTIVCAQAGNVNTGAFDPLATVADLAREHGAWLHVDGAFGLWAAASPALRQLVAGVELADSWATDAHKWLNVPHDSGLVFTAHPEPHRAAMAVTAAYLVRGAGGERDNDDWVPEGSRRARGFAVWAALRTLGHDGVRDLVERCCGLARRMADRLEQEPDVEILNHVALNQVLVRFRPPGSGDLAAADALTDRVIKAVQRDGTCWVGGTTWHGRRAMRISVSNWSTSEADIDRSAAAILKCARSAV